MICYSYSENKMKTAKKIQLEIEPKYDAIITDKISTLLTEIVRMNSKKPFLDSDPFSKKIVPSITVSDYLERIKKYTKIEKGTLILAMIYIDRICNLNRIILSPYNIHRILLGCCLVALKYNEDVIFKNIFYAKVAGVSLKEINAIELYTLSFLSFNLYVEEEIFELYKSNLTQE